MIRHFTLIWFVWVTNQNIFSSELLLIKEEYFNRREYDCLLLIYYQHTSQFFHKIELIIFILVQVSRTMLFHPSNWKYIWMSHFKHLLTNSIWKLMKPFAISTLDGDIHIWSYIFSSYCAVLEISKSTLHSSIDFFSKILENDETIQGFPRENYVCDWSTESFNSRGLF